MNLPFTKKTITYFLVIVCLFSIARADKVYAVTTLTNALANVDYSAYKRSRYAKESWNQTVKTGFEAFHSENYDVAQTSLYKAFNAGCESPILLFMLALLAERNQAYYSSLEYYKMAQQGFKKANKSHRYANTFEENYGRALLNSGKQSEAIAILKKASKKTKSFWLLKLLGMLAYEGGDTLNAVSYFERAVRVRSPDVTKGELVYIYTLLGKLFLSRGEQDGAHRYYQKALELDPNNAEAKQFMVQIERAYQQDKAYQLMDKLSDF